MVRVGFILVSALVAGAAAEESEGSGSGAANASDLETSGMLPMLPMLDEDEELSSGEEEGSGDPHADCWDTALGHPDNRLSDTTLYSHCPEANPATWQEQDLGLDMHCGNDSATFFFDLSLYESVDWLKDVTVTVTREYGILKDLVKEVTDFSTKEVQLDSLCPGTDYFICLNFNPSLSERRNVFCQECSTAARAPAANPTDLMVMGIRELQLEWSPVEPECSGTQYDVLVDGEVEETLSGTQKWIIKDPGTYQIAVRAQNDEGPSTAELNTVTHVLQDLMPPSDVLVEYKVEDSQLIATISWKNSMTFSASDITLKGYYLNLDNQELGETTTLKPIDVDFEAHDMTIHNIEETSIEVNFTDTMDWNIEFSLQTFYSGDVSNRTETLAVFSKQMELKPPSHWISGYEYPEGGTTALKAFVKLSPETEFEFSGLETVVTIWAANGTILNTTRLGEATEFEQTLDADYGADALYSLSVTAGGKQGLQSEKQKLRNNVAFGYYYNFYILPYLVALVVVLILILLAIIYCICNGSCCRPLESPKKEKKGRKSPETKILLAPGDVNDNGCQGGGTADVKVPLLDSQTPTAFQRQKSATPDIEKVTTPLAMKKKFLFSKSRDSIINMTEPGWMWRHKNISSDMF